MAGHSKWANIKRQKARVDAKKNKTFTQLSRAIIVAARNGIPDPAGNFQLRTAITKAKAAGVPNDNIERSLAKGAGTYQESGVTFAEIRYEGYGAGGVAVLVEALTDNRNRTAAEVRAAFSKNGGNLGETGCVSWMFEQKGVVVLADDFTEETLLELAIETGADSYELILEADFQGAELFTEVANLENLAQALQDQGFDPQESEIRWFANNTAEITLESDMRSLLKTIETLEQLDDVQNVTTNHHLAASLLNSDLQS